MSEHEMVYRAATMGFSRLGIPDNPHAGWSCTCGHWHYRAQAISDRETGNNLAEAQHSYAVHVRASTPR